MIEIKLIIHKIDSNLSRNEKNVTINKAKRRRRTSRSNA